MALGLVWLSDCSASLGIVWVGQVASLTRLAAGAGGWVEANFGLTAKGPGPPPCGLLYM